MRVASLYYNGYATNFTLEDFITKAGLEIKVNRKYYKLVKADKTIKDAGSRGQAVDEKVEKYERQELPSGAELKSGDLVEIELEIDSKNDYEYLVFEDMKPAGFEAVDQRSGYTGNEIGAYVEFRDNRVVFFARALARGKHSVSYRMRAEIPGKFSALPTRASAMYAPELKGNSDELKIDVKDVVDLAEKQAIDIATKELVKNGRKAENYKASVKFDSSEKKWIVSFDPKNISYPGGDVLVTVAESTGKVVFMPGE